MGCKRPISPKIEAPRPDYFSIGLPCQWLLMGGWVVREGVMWDAEVFMGIREF